MEYDFDVTVTVSIDFEHRERSLLRRSVGHDQIEAPFKRFKDEYDYEDVKAIRDCLQAAIEWGVFEERGDVLSAEHLHGKLDSVMVDFELERY